MHKLKALFLLSLASQLIVSCTNSANNEHKINFKYKSTQYVGETACISCHQKEYHDWQGSHHDWAMKLPNDSTVQGDFSDVSFAADGESYFFHKSDTTYFVKTGLPGKEIDYPIAYTFGFTPLQQYLIKFPDGKYQTLRASWDTVNKRWFNQYTGQNIPPHDWLHWTQGGQRWNTMCAECHSTNLHKNYNLSMDEFNTTYAVINVSCEACHGPGGAHMNWAEGEKPTGDPQLVSLGRERTAQFNQCAGCHARRVRFTEVMKPEVAFDDQFRLQTISAEYYHPDGQIREEDYVFGSFVQSKMFHKGVKCSDCHNVHSMELKYQGNLLCMQCHDKQYNSPSHHFHQQDEEASQCISCHMTGAVYMGNDFRRDHSFRVPRPDQSVEYSTPNACTGCHTDKSDQWAADWVVKWYGKERPDHFSDHLLKASRPPYDDRTRQEVLQFIQQMDYPAISRATALEYYPLVGDEADYTMLLASLKDSSALVRANALDKFQIFPADQRANIGLKHVNDQARVVRLAAARLMIEQNLNQLSPADRGMATKAREELETMLHTNADFPLGRLQLGDYYFRQQNFHDAIHEYEMALKMDSLLTPVYGNLATAYSIVGKNEKALQTLTTLIVLEPKYGRAYYLRALLQHEMEHNELAIADLKKSIAYDSQNFRAYYNLANLYLAAGRLPQAERTIKTGLKLQPESQDGQYLLNLIRSKLNP